MLIPDQIQEDGQPAPGSVRPIHRADVHVIEPQGSELWLDVKMAGCQDSHSRAGPHGGQRTSPRRIDQMQGIRPTGRLQLAGPRQRDDACRPGTKWQNNPGAQAIFNRIIIHRLHVLVRQGIPFSFAKRTASSELWGPISRTLLRAAWQAHAECAPRLD